MLEEELRGTAAENCSRKRKMGKETKKEIIQENILEGKGSFRTHGARFEQLMEYPAKWMKIKPHLIEISEHMGKRGYPQHFKGSKTALCKGPRG